MTERETIKTLEDLSSTAREYAHIKIMSGYSEALQIAISALEKQTPRPVRIEYDRRHNYFLHFCPVCGGLAREYKYCSDCGQKLSYGEEAEEEDE